jgi:hypothetical protein
MSTPDVQPLSQDLVDLLPTIANHWNTVSRKTGPLDPERVQESVRKHYTACGYEMGEDFQFHIVPSPRAGAILAAKLVHSTDTPTTEQINEQLHLCGYGNVDAPWMAYYDVYLRDGRQEAPPYMETLMHLCQEVGYFWPLDQAFIASEFPMEIHLDAEHRLHNMDGPAYWFRDGTRFYYWHGVLVPERVITEDPNSWSVADIFAETNQEVRRARMERYGWERFAKDNTPIQFDDYGRLFHITTPEDEEDLFIVEVENSTPEPDGTYKMYYLRVPPGTETARAGIAATFQMTADEYAPLIET